MRLPTFWDRYNYLKIGGRVGKETFGANRYLNQMFYTSDVWRRFRRDMILRDQGLDLASEGLDIMRSIYVHHITPITDQDVLNHNEELLLNPENVITCSFQTHQAIHYGVEGMLPYFDLIERRPDDTTIWR